MTHKPKFYEYFIHINEDENPIAVVKEEFIAKQIAMGLQFYYERVDVVKTGIAYTYEIPYYKSCSENVLTCGVGRRG